MSDGYLWDRTGPPDPAIVDLEQRLAVFRPRRDVRPDRDAPALPPSRPPRRRVPRPVRWIAAAAVVAALGALAFRTLAPTSWVVESARAATFADGRPLGAGTRLAPGDVIETGPDGAVQVEVGWLGSVRVGADSRLRLLGAERRRQRAALERGRVEARIVAAPYVFAIETAHAVAHDMGCAYAIETGPDGGTLRVTAGWIDLDGHGRRSLVPAGMSAPFRAGAGPGTPRSVRADPAFVAALDRLDAGDGAALEEVLARARFGDAATLVNLLWRLPRGERGRVFDRLAAWRAPPGSIDRARVVGGDLAGLADWWPSLGLARPRRVTLPDGSSSPGPGS